MLLTYIGFTLGISTAASVIGLIRLRLKEGPRLRVPGWPWVPVLFVTIITLITLSAMIRQPLESTLGLATLAVGWLAWWIFHRR